MMEKLALRPAEAAAALGVSRRTVQDWLSRGVLPCKRLGRVVLIPVDELRAWLSRRENQPESCQSSTEVRRRED